MQWRRSVGEICTLYDIPGHKFGPGARPVGAKTVEAALYAGWDAVLFGRPLRSIIRLSRDDFIEVSTKSRDDLSKLTREITRLGLTAL